MHLEDTRHFLSAGASPRKANLSRVNLWRSVGHKRTVSAGGAPISRSRGDDSRKRRVDADDGDDGAGDGTATMMALACTTGTSRLT